MEGEVFEELEAHQRRIRVVKEGEDE